MIISLLAILACTILMLAKNENAYRNRMKIMNAIYNYGMVEKDINSIYFYDDMEEYDKTTWRLWDWGCTRILPSYKYDLIKPYIENEKGGDAK